MPWVKLDDSMPDHPKLAGLSDAAFAMHVRGLCYSAKHLTDGFVPSLIVNRLGKPSAVKELIANGVWDAGERGWQIHDFLVYQRSRADVEQERQKNRDRLKRFRERAPKAETGDQQPEKRERNAVTPPVAQPVSNAAPVPSRPVPTNEERHESSSGGPSDGRAVWSRIVEEMDLTEDNRKNWFEPCEVYSYEPGRLIINARKSFIGEWLNRHFWKRVREVAAAIEPGLRIELITKPLSVVAR